MARKGKEFQRISPDLQLTEPDRLTINPFKWRTLPADGGAFLLGYNHQSIHLSSKEGCPSG